MGHFHSAVEREEQLGIHSLFHLYHREIEITDHNGGVFLFIDEITEYIANISERYEKYGVEKTDNGYIFFAIMTLILVFFVMNKARILKSSESLEKFSKINFFCYALWVMRLATRTVERVSFYYLPSTILIVSHSTKAFKRHENNVLYTLILAVLLIALFLYRMRGINYVFC